MFVKWDGPWAFSQPEYVMEPTYMARPVVTLQGLAAQPTGVPPIIEHTLRPHARVIYAVVHQLPPIRPPAHVTMWKGLKPCRSTTSSDTACTRPARDAVQSLALRYTRRSGGPRRPPDRTRSTRTPPSESSACASVDSYQCRLSFHRLCQYSRWPEHRGTPST